MNLTETTLYSRLSFHNFKGSICTYSDKGPKKRDTEHSIILHYTIHGIIVSNHNL